MYIPAGDRLLEEVYDLVNAQPTELARADLARTAKLAVEYRIQQRERDRMARAIARVAEEKRILKATLRGRDMQQRASTDEC